MGDTWIEIDESLSEQLVSTLEEDGDSVMGSLSLASGASLQEGGRSGANR